MYCYEFLSEASPLTSSVTSPSTCKSSLTSFIHFSPSFHLHLLLFSFLFLSFFLSPFSSSIYGPSQHLTSFLFYLLHLSYIVSFFFFFFVSVFLFFSFSRLHLHHNLLFSRLPRSSSQIPAYFVPSLLLRLPFVVTIILIVILTSPLTSSSSAAEFLFTSSCLSFPLFFFLKSNYQPSSSLSYLFINPVVDYNASCFGFFFPARAEAGLNIHIMV